MGTFILVESPLIFEDQSSKSGHPYLGDPLFLGSLILVGRFLIEREVLERKKTQKERGA